MHRKELNGFGNCLQLLRPIQTVSNAYLLQIYFCVSMMAYIFLQRILLRFKCLFAIVNNARKTLHSYDKCFLS